MRIKLIIDKDLNGFGKVLPAGTVIEVLNDYGINLINAGIGKDADAPLVGLKVKKIKNKIGTKQIHTRVIEENGE